MSVDTATTISNLIGPITAVLVPTIGATVLSIVNFINHHVHTTPNQQKILDKVAAVEGKIMAIDATIDAQKGVIGAFGASDPGISKAVADHAAQISVAESKIAQLTEEINKLKGVIPTEDNSKLKRSNSAGWFPSA